MADHEAFDLLNELKTYVNANGGTFDDQVLAFDNKPSGEFISFMMVSAHMVTIHFATYAGGYVFLRKCETALTKLLTKSKISIKIKVRDVTISLKADLSKPKADLKILAEGENKKD
jgi:hypothetical protein